MTESAPWWVWPFLAALVLISIHTYLGLHVIRRKVLFVDLALAQIAAMGSTVAFLFGYELSDPTTKWVSLVFAIAGAWVFSVTRSKGERVPQEAVIGLSYAIAAAGSILLSAENPHGAEHLRDIVAGSILVVTPADVRDAALLYAVIGAVHFFFRKQFLLASSDPEEAARSGLAVHRWDFLFYVSFALVITVSVHIAGVLLVFCLLIAPAVCASIFAESTRARLLVGWGTSVSAAVGGLGLSGFYDWPPAPSVIAVYSAILILAGLWSYVSGSADRTRAAVRVILTSLLLVAVSAGLVRALTAGVGRSEVAHEGHSHESHSERPESGDGPKLGSEVDRLITALTDPSMDAREAAATALERTCEPKAMLPLESAIRRTEDEWARLALARAAARCGSKLGVDELFELSGRAEAGAVITEAAKVATEVSMSATRDEWSSKRASVKWSSENRRFE